MARIDINYNEIILVDEAGGEDNFTFEILAEFVNKIKESKGLLHGYQVIEREEVAADALLFHRPLDSYYSYEGDFNVLFANIDGTSYTVSAAIPEGADVPS